MSHKKELPEAIQKLIDDPDGWHQDKFIWRAIDEAQEEIIGAARNVIRIREQGGLRLDGPQEEALRTLEAEVQYLEAIETAVENHRNREVNQEAEDKKMRQLKKFLSTFKDGPLVPGHKVIEAMEEFEKEEKERSN